METAFQSAVEDALQYHLTTLLSEPESPVRAYLECPCKRPACLTFRGC